MLRILSYAVFLSVCIFQGCSGYHWGVSSGKVKQEAGAIYLSRVENLTYEPGIVGLVTSSVLQKIEKDPTLKVARNKNQADSILKIEIKERKRTPTRVSRFNLNLAAEYELRIVATMSLKKNGKGRFLLPNQEVSGRTHFFVRNDLQEGERQAVPLAIEKLSQEILDRIISSWK